MTSPNNLNSKAIAAIFYHPHGLSPLARHSVLMPSFFLSPSNVIFLRLHFIFLSKCQAEKETSSTRKYIYKSPAIEKSRMILKKSLRIETAGKGAVYHFFWYFFLMKCFVTKCSSMVGSRFIKTHCRDGTLAGSSRYKLHANFFLCKQPRKNEEISSNSF